MWVTIATGSIPHKLFSTVTRRISIQSPFKWHPRIIRHRTYINSPRDVVIYEHKRSTRFNKLLTFIGVGQWFVTGYMSAVMFQSMPAFFSWIPTDETEIRKEGSTRLRLADWKYRAGFSLFVMGTSTAMLVTICVLSLSPATLWPRLVCCPYLTTSGRRLALSVTSITLMKNSSNVLINTITPIGTPFKVITPIVEVSAIQPRTTQAGNIPLKLKCHRFHFLVDKSGHFLQPTLYDRTVGISRNFGQVEK